MLINSPIIGQLLQGRIIDKISHEPLPLASIKIGLRGTISTNEGYFKISIKDIDHQRKNKLIISFIGYKGQELPTIDLKNHMIIEMEPTQKYLEEVKITNGAEEIIKKAIRNFALNYAEKPYALYGSQSEELVNQNQVKLYYLKADLISIMPRFHSGKKIKIEMKNLHQKDFYLADLNQFTIWGATGRSIEYFDFSNAYYSVLDSSKLKKFRFIVEELMLDNRPLYKISFTDKKIKINSKESFLLIEKSSYAIICLAVESANNDNLWAKIYQSVVRVDYQKFEEKWYLKSINQEHKNEHWPLNKDKFDRLKINVQIDRIDTLVNFDIDYSKDMQRADVLYLKVEGKFTEVDSIKLPSLQFVQPKKKNRFVKFWYQNVSIGKTISITPLNSSLNSFDVRFLENKWKIDTSYQITTKPINPILIGFSIELKLIKPIKLFLNVATNWGIGGRQLNLVGLGMKFEKIIRPDKRPLAVYISPQVGVLIERIPILGLQTFTSAQYDWMQVKAEPFQLVFNKAVPLLSIALGYSYEISRKSHLNFEIQYNYANREVNNLSIYDPDASILFAKNRILTSSISNHPLSNLTFSIKLF